MSKKKTKKSSNKVIQIKDNHDIAFFRIQDEQDIPLGTNSLHLNQNDIVLTSYDVNITKNLYKRISDVYQTTITSNTDLTNETLLIYRYGGIGDILNTLYSVFALKTKFKNLQIGFICSPTYFSLFSYFSDILDGVFGVFTSYQKIQDKNYFIDLTGVIENDPLNSNLSMPYLIGKQFHLTENEIQNAIKYLTTKISNTISKNRNGIGIQYMTNVPIRNYDIDYMCDLINLLLEKYPNEKITIIGHPQEKLWRDYIIARCDYKINTLQSASLAESISSVADFKIVIGPDSSLLHIAGITKTPLIGLFGPFPSNLRIADYKNAIGIDGKLDNCSPCMRHHPTHWCKYNGSECLCLNAITPDIIVNQVDKLMELY